MSAYWNITTVPRTINTNFPLLSQVQSHSILRLDCHFTISTFTCSCCNISDTDPEREDYPEGATKESKAINFK
ncbi:hypothetical protein ACN42_g2235 [Penicillium freii]|uniref:Uncharacterized protein n=1 Tax=Penicillium freii TaxID=48697 RepID=A0A101MQH9_PENFR|nr:hypothetical protein ACN42_g2235 [Penicillium freii]